MQHRLLMVFCLSLLGAHAHAQEYNALTPTITGAAAGETINGTAGNDVIDAGGGNDIVNGNGGDDTICGGDERPDRSFVRFSPNPAIAGFLYYIGQLLKPRRRTGNTQQIPITARICRPTASGA